MKKLFAHNKSKAVKVNQVSREQAASAEESLIPTPIYQQHAVFPKHPQPPPPVAVQPVRTSSQDQWDVHTEETHVSSTAPLINSRGPSLSTLPPGASPPVPSPLAPRSPSPYNTISSIPPIPPPKQSTNGPREREREPPVKKTSGGAAGALAALRALDPPNNSREQRDQQTRSIYEDRHTPSEIEHRDTRSREPEKREKKAFWSWDKERDKGHDREREKDQGKEEELARIIGWLAATASEDWRLVLEVCDRASSSEANAKEAIRALRREFRYGEPAAQLSAARVGLNCLELWALMLRNSSELFIAQSTTRKFLDTLEDVLNNPKTVPVVKERLLNVIAAAAFASGNKHSRGGFRGLWRRVKPADKPDEGIPFDPEDAMFTPPVPSSRLSYYSDGGISSFPLDALPTTPTGIRPTPSPTRNRVIPLDEDIRRLLQECKIGSGNAALLSQALAMTRPEELHNKDIIKEFYQKCHSSQELIYAQIPWATAGAERSRGQRQQDLEARKRDQPHDSHVLDGGEATIEEKLLDALLAANMELVSALRQFDDLERLAIEYQSKLEVRMDRRRVQQLEHENALGIQSIDVIGRSRSRSPSPSLHSITRSYSPAPSVLLNRAYTDSPTPPALAPPPPAPQGPRAPPSHHSRTPSPGTPSIDIQAASPAGDNFGAINDSFSLMDAHHHVLPTEPDSGNLDDNPARPAQPSAKALGKRREQQVEIVEPSAAPKSPDSLFEVSDGLFSHQENEQDSDSEKSAVSANPWHRPVRYVYDAAAERTEQRIREGHTMLVNGVH